MITYRIALHSAAPAVYGAISALDDSAQFEPALRELVRIRASQLNGCGYCVDYHSRDAQRAGEQDRRIFALTTWRDSPFIIAINAWNRVGVGTRLQPEVAA